MSVELLNQETVVEYLTDKKVITPGDNPQVEVLTGGVSNVVLAITTSNQKLVLKQALAELAVSEKWEADQRRAIVEADGCQCSRRRNYSGKRSSKSKQTVTNFLWCGLHRLR